MPRHGDPAALQTRTGFPLSRFHPVPHSIAVEERDLLLVYAPIMIAPIAT